MNNEKQDKQVFTCALGLRDDWPTKWPYHYKGTSKRATAVALFLDEAAAEDYLEEQAQDLHYEQKTDERVEMVPRHIRVHGMRITLYAVVNYVVIV